MSTTHYRHHGVTFQIDTMDWGIAAEKSSDAAEQAMISLLSELTEAEVAIIARTWTDAESEADSRNSNDAACQIIEEIENAAFTLATKNWRRVPDTGCNCSIHVHYPDNTETQS